MNVKQMLQMLTTEQVTALHLHLSLQQHNTFFPQSDSEQK